MYAQFYLIFEGDDQMLEACGRRVQNVAELELQAKLRLKLAKIRKYLWLARGWRGSSISEKIDAWLSVSDTK